MNPDSEAKSSFVVFSYYIFPIFVSSFNALRFQPPLSSSYRAFCFESSFFVSSFQIIKTYYVFLFFSKG